MIVTGDDGRRGTALAERHSVACGCAPSADAATTERANGTRSTPSGALPSSMPSMTRRAREIASNLGSSTATRARSYAVCGHGPSRSPTPCALATRRSPMLFSGSAGRPADRSEAASRGDAGSSVRHPSAVVHDRRDRSAVRDVPRRAARVLAPRARLVRRWPVAIQPAGVRQTVEIALPIVHTFDEGDLPPVGEPVLDPLVS